MSILPGGAEDADLGDGEAAAAQDPPGVDAR